MMKINLFHAGLPLLSLVYLKQRVTYYFSPSRIHICAVRKEAYRYYTLV